MCSSPGAGSEAWPSSEMTRPLGSDHSRRGGRMKRRLPFSISRRARWMIKLLFFQLTCDCSSLWAWANMHDENKDRVWADNRPVCCIWNHWFDKLFLPWSEQKIITLKRKILQDKTFFCDVAHCTRSSSARKLRQQSHAFIVLSFFCSHFLHWEVQLFLVNQFVQTVVNVAAQKNNWVINF